MNKNKRPVKYQYHEWWVPCSDTQQTHLFAKWDAESNRETAVCGIKNGGCANGRDRQPYCQLCIDGARTAEDKIYLALCKKYRVPITSILISIRKLNDKVDSINPLLLGGNNEA